MVAQAESSNLWMVFALLTVGCWGLYGVLLHTGQVAMGDPVNGRYKAFFWVGIAYFLVAVLAPATVLVANGSDWSFPSKGLWWSLIAGIAGAIGAFGVLLAFGAKGHPAAVMSIIFAGAPVVNAVVSLAIHPPAGGFKDLKWQFVLGIVLAAVGGMLVSFYKPGGPPKGKSDGGAKKAAQPGEGGGMSDQVLVELSGVHKTYDSAGGGSGVEVLRGVDLRLSPGESVAVVGPSGCGKSTLLDILGGLQMPTAGSVTFAGRDLAGLDETERAAFRNEELGYIFQSHHLLPQCSALENVLVPTIVDRDAQRRAGARDRALALLDRVGLGARKDHRPAQLSGGERQRVAVVRALINQPRLLLADEPTGALDGAAAAALGELLLEFNRSEGITLLTVTHSADLAASMGRTETLADGLLTSAVPS